MSDEVRPLTDEELEQVKARAEAVNSVPVHLEYDSDVNDVDYGPITSWPWRILGVCNFAEERGSEDVAQFVAHAFSDVPRLLATIVARDAEIRELGARITELEGRDITGWQDELYAGDSTDGEELCEPGEMSDAEEHGRHEPLHQEPFDRFRYR
jgi:hypothetical protein